MPKKAHTAVRVSAILAITFIVGLLCFGAFVVLTGRPLYTASDVDTVAAYTTSGSLVTVTVDSTRGGVLKFTTAAAAAKIVITMKDVVKDYEGINQLNLDISKMQLGGYDRVRVKLSDSVTSVLLGGYDSAMTAIQAPIDKESWNTLDEYKKVQVVVEFYNATGYLTDAVKADTHEMTVDFVIAGGTGSVTAFIASCFVAIVASLRKAIAGITGALTSFVTALVTSEAAIIFLVGFGVIVIIYLFGPKKGYKKIF